MNNGRRNLIRKYEPWMIQALNDHVSEGCSVGSFSGRYNITDSNWRKWIMQGPELAEIRKRYNAMKNKQKSYWGMK